MNNETFPNTVVTHHATVHNFITLFQNTGSVSDIPKYNKPSVQSEEKLLNSPCKYL